MMSATNRTLWIVPVVLAMAAGAASAAVLDFRVDFNEQVAPTDVNWNVINAPETFDVPLKDFTTGDTSHGATVSVYRGGSVTLNDSTATTGWNVANAGPSWLDLPQKNAALDYFWMNWNGIAVIDVKGLDTGKTYHVELIAAEDNQNESVPFTLFSNDAPQQIDFNLQLDGYDAGNWMTWNDVTPDGTGLIQIKTVTSGGSRRSGVNPHINAVRVVEVPEPATLGLLGLGLPALLRRRRRTR